MNLRWGERLTTHVSISCSGEKVWLHSSLTSRLTPST